MIIKDNIYINADSLGHYITDLCQLFTYNNPDFYRKKALKLSVKNVPATFVHYRLDVKDDGRVLVLPRGGLDRVKKFYADMNKPLRIMDERITLPEIDCNLSKDTILEKQQNTIIDTLLENDGGLIQMDVAGGKTISALGFLSRIKQPTLILFNRHQLKQQWLDEIQQRLIGDFTIGDYSEGKLIHGDVVLGLVQTIHTVVDEDMTFLDKFGATIVDECLDGDTLINVPGGLERLSNIKRDDLVFTPSGEITKVLAVKRVKKQAYKYNISGGSFIIASEDHKVPVFDYSRGKVVLCRIGETANLLLVKRPHDLKKYVSSFNYGLYNNIAISNKEYLGERELIDITIEDRDHLFVANGIAVSNCHALSSDTYLKVINRMGAKYRVGITATVERKDQKHFLIFDALGDVRVDITASDLKHRITTFEYTMVNTNISHKFPMRNRWTGKRKEDVRDFTALLGLLVDDKERNELILENIRHYIKEGHFVLVLSDRVKHNRHLHKVITDEGYKTLLVVNNSRGYDWDKIRRDTDLNVIFATTSMVSEGLDIPRLSALFLVCPSSNLPKLKQKLGRVRRKCEGKQTPIVVDFVDNGVYDLKKNEMGDEHKVYPLRTSARTREKFYRKLLEEYHSKDKANEGDLQGSIGP